MAGNVSRRDGMRMRKKGGEKRSEEEEDGHGGEEVRKAGPF
jgi:hypothetical protein